MIPRIVYLTDDAAAAAPYTRDGRTGAIHLRAPLTWTGIREYPQIRVEGRAARVLRRPEEIQRPGYIDTIRRITPTLGHPVDDDGRQILIDSTNYRRFAVGSVGDAIDIEVVDGYPCPVGNITVVAEDAINAILAGNNQVSQGFYALIASPPDDESDGVWQGPNGPESYDLEHICDPDHPAAIQHADENPDFDRQRIGANHIAVGIPAGRGLAQAQARPLAQFDCGDVIFLDSLQVQMSKTKISFAVKLPKSFTGAVPCLDALEIEANDALTLGEFLAEMQLFVSSMAARAVEADQSAEVSAGEAAVAAEQAALAASDTLAARTALDKAQVTLDALEREVAPLREAAIAAAKVTALRVAPGVVLDAADSLVAVQRAAVSARIPSMVDAPDATIGGAWAAMIAALDTAIVPIKDTPSDQFMAATTPSTVAIKSASRALFRV